MDAKRIDRRKNRTRRLLRAALLSLILERGYDALTIEDITEKADLGRATFYLHYKDKEELLLESIDELVDDLVKQVSKLLDEGWRVHPEKAGAQDGSGSPFLMVFVHAAQNASLYRIILRGEGGPKVSARMKSIIIRELSRFIEQRAARDGSSAQPRVPMDVFGNYLAGALLGTLTWWLENDMPYPPEQAAGVFQQVFFLGALYALGVDAPGT
jgi:AcrR family transcriptional regulator